MNALEEDWDRAANPNGKRREHLLSPETRQMMRVFFYMGWSAGAGRVMQAGRSIDETTQMLRIMEIMDCIQQDRRFLGVERDKLVESPGLAQALETPPNEKH